MTSQQSEQLQEIYDKLMGNITHSIYCKVNLTSASTSNAWQYMSLYLYIDGKQYTLLSNSRTGVLANTNGQNINLTSSTITHID